MWFVINHLCFDVYSKLYSHIDCNHRFSLNVVRIWCARFYDVIRLYFFWLLIIYFLVMDCFSFTFWSMQTHLHERENSCTINQALPDIESSRIYWEVDRSTKASTSTGWIAYYWKYIHIFFWPYLSLRMYVDPKNGGHYGLGSQLELMPWWPLKWDTKPKTHSKWK